MRTEWGAKLAPAVSERDHVQGSKTAGITLVEYGDYQCPYCGQAYPIVKELQQQLGNKLRFVFRNFPLSTMHPHAEHAAEAAETAGAHGKFWEMHDMLYENQEALGDENLIQYATAIGLNEAGFTSEMVKHTQAARVREDFMSGVRSGVNGTPTFFINGVRHDGPFDLESLLQAMEAVQ